MRIIIFNDLDNFNGSLNIINQGFEENKKRFWNINKYIPFILEKIKNLDKSKFSKEDLKLIKTYVYTGKYSSKIISGFIWNCKRKIKEIQEIINREDSLRKEISGYNLDKKLNEKIINHVSNIINIFDKRKNLYIERINKQIRNRKGQQRFFEKIKENPFIELRTTPLKQAEGEISQKGVDVKLATDLVNLAHTNSYDVALILGGDTDLVEGVKLVKEHLSKIVIIVSYYIEGEPLSSNISDLKEEASYFLNLKDFNKEEFEAMSEPKE